MTYIYKGTSYEVHTGARGGQYIMLGDKKHYIKKSTTRKSSNKKSKPEIKAKPLKLTGLPKTYVCYYALYKNGELVDDFKEWCKAYSELEARAEFESRYPNHTIQQIIKQ